MFRTSPKGSAPYHGRKSVVRGLLGGSHYVDHEENVLAVLYCAKEGAIGGEAKVTVLGREGSLCANAVIAMKNLQGDGHSLGLAPNR